MTLNPNSLQDDRQTLENIEKATLRMVTQAIYNFCADAELIFAQEQDEPGDIAEDITREALDSLGFAKIPTRLFGKIDFKRSQYLFHPEYSVKQALFVDSKAEAPEGSRTATIQTSQTSMHIRQLRAGKVVDIPGELPTIYYTKAGDSYLTTTVFVKYHYETLANNSKKLLNIVLACLPNGMLQNYYNPDENTSFWRAGRDAPTLGEAFRVRIHFDDLKAMANWRVQTINLQPASPFVWDE